MSSGTSQRVWEIDALRGIALVLMIVFHFIFDLNEFYGFPVHYNSGAYYYIGKVSAILFILISAVSCIFSSSNLKRAVKFLGIALAITVGTHLYNPAFGIKFGILHFLGTCILLYPLFRDLNKYVLAILGTMIILVGRYFGEMQVHNNYLFLFNLTSNTWVSADYYPLFPWLGMFLYGIALGKTVYHRKQSLLKRFPGNKFFGYIGRHTLSVYLIHQPLLLLFIGIYVKLKGE